MNNNDYINKGDIIVEYTKDNFFSYLVDKINYKILKCYKLVIFSNLKNNYAFYAFIVLLFIILIIDILFFLYSIPKLRKILLKDALEDKIKIKKKESKNEKTKILLTVNKSSKNEKTKILLTVNKSSKNSKNKNSNQIKIKGLKSSKKISLEKFLSKNRKKNPDKPIKKSLYFQTNNYHPPKLKQEASTKNLKNILSLKNYSRCQSNNDILLKEETKEEIKDKEKNELNELPYKLAVLLDKRNIIYIFFSIIIHKFDLIHIFLGDEQLKIILLNEFIFSLSLNFFINALLYSDEIVSNKYHNNGQLDFVVSLVVTLLSNIITSIICFFINFSEIVEEKLDLINEIKKRKYYYVKNIIKLFKYLKIKFIINNIIELIIIIFGFYYVIIFCAIYSKSIKSLLFNYLTSLLEDIIKSLIIAVIITICRRIGISCLNKYFYNTSKYINSKF
jgi:hypothetical protein